MSLQCPRCHSPKSLPSITLQAPCRHRHRGVARGASARLVVRLAQLSARLPPCRHHPRLRIGRHPRRTGRRRQRPRTELNSASRSIATSWPTTSVACGRRFNLPA